MFEKIKDEAWVLLQEQVMFLSRSVEAADISYFLAHI